jgi:hypothetical protein
MGFGGGMSPDNPKSTLENHQPNMCLTFWTHHFAMLTLLIQGEASRTTMVCQWILRVDPHNPGLVKAQEA